MVKEKKLVVGDGENSFIFICGAAKLDFYKSSHGEIFKFSAGKRLRISQSLSKIFRDELQIFLSGAQISFLSRLPGYTHTSESNSQGESGFFSISRNTHLQLHSGK